MRSRRSPGSAARRRSPRPARNRPPRPPRPPRRRRSPEPAAMGETFLRPARWIALLLPAALVGGAWIGQLFFGLYPCEMCHWQRWPHYAAIALALLAFAVPGRVNQDRKRTRLTSSH